MVVIELFAGVGGFRLGLEGFLEKGKYYSPTQNYKGEILNPEYFKTGYSNQWEPGTKTQIASKIYTHRFGDMGHDNRNIEEVSGSEILEHINQTLESDRLSEPLLLVGGFPCQDYSVANGLHNSQGILGKKGVLWWHIERILREIKDLGRQPEVLVLENVDRLLKSPSTARGRDFALMLTTLESLGYVVEYRVINAAEYGMPQKRKRVFIVGYLKSSVLNSWTSNVSETNCEDEFSSKSLMSKAFSFRVLSKLSTVSLPSGEFDLNALKKVLLKVEQMGFGNMVSPFGDAGVLINGCVYPFKTLNQFDRQKLALIDVLQPIEEVHSDFIVDENELEKWAEVKGPKKIKRLNPVGKEYWFVEGKMELYDAITKPSRTIITSEGGKSASRTRHLIKIGLTSRRLTPIELERLNMFPDDFTSVEGISSSKRAFLMGNALVVGIVERMRRIIIEQYGV